MILFSTNIFQTSKINPLLCMDLYVHEDNLVPLYNF